METRNDLVFIIYAITNIYLVSELFAVSWSLVPTVHLSQSEFLLSISTLISLISDHLRHRFGCIGRLIEVRNSKTQREYCASSIHGPVDSFASGSDVFGIIITIKLFLRTFADILLRLFPWLSIQTLMHLRHGRTKSPPKITLIALHLHQPLPRRLPRCSPLMHFHHRAQSRPYLEVGQAQGGSMRMKINTFLVHMVCKARQPHRMRRWPLQHTLNANHLE